MASDVDSKLADMCARRHVGIPSGPARAHLPVIGCIAPASTARPCGVRRTAGSDEPPDR